MREKNKNKRVSLTDFIRYRNDKMKGKERNAFERELQKDPFAEAASEGFAVVTTQEASDDIAGLQMHLKKRVIKRQRLIFYRIAASIAVLMLVSSIFIIIEKTSTKKHFTSVIAQTEPLEIEESGPITLPAEIVELSEKSAVVAKEIPDRVVELSVKRESEEPVTPATEDRIAASKEKKAVLQAEDEEFEAEQDTPVNVRSDPRLSAQSEVVEVGYGVAKDESGKEEMPDGYIPPLPAVGKSNFDAYIRENIRQPDTTTSGQKVVVILNFIVHTDGSIDSIRILRSPGKLFSDEAIRLIRSGPAWKPAENNGSLIEDQVRVRIVFK